jgi:hypothetical protein
MFDRLVCTETHVHAIVMLVQCFLTGIQFSHVVEPVCFQVLQLVRVPADQTRLLPPAPHMLP